MYVFPSDKHGTSDYLNENKKKGKERSKRDRSYCLDDQAVHAIALQMFCSPHGVQSTDVQMLLKLRQ
jgi:hypothetical protein